jgi:predicted SnoaL-like aldol condensation-catalyzing enzyme
MRRCMMTTNISERNKDVVLEAFDRLFNQRDYAAAEGFWSPNDLQHSAHIPPGRDGLFNLIRSLPVALRHEPGLIVAEGPYVILHGRFSGHGLARNWIVVDIILVRNGLLTEHWDVIQDEAGGESQSGMPMFESTYPFC